MSRAPSSRRRIRSVTAAVVALGGSLAILPGGATAAPLDPDRERELAQAHFQVYLLTSTDFRPANITCTTPSGIAAAGELVCYAIVNDRETISAVATPDGDHAFWFTAIGKANGTGGAADPVVADPGPATSGAFADAFMAEYEGDGPILEAMLAEVADVEVVQIRWQPDVATLFVELSSTAGGDQGTADALAWATTNVLASAWEPESPVRAADANVQPRLEVMVDGALYGTPFDVMVGVADYTILEQEWLEITTTAASSTAAAGAKQRQRSKPVGARHAPRSAAELAGSAAGTLFA